ncbi:hypothetical protein ACFPK2_02345 [Bosea minatitlanensis]|uniref:Uncharacterized protein n=1 Tax=Bosea minatitlanensis TaxID=128782 RepID=A0ABW0F068_9HYPH
MAPAFLAAAPAVERKPPDRPSRPRMAVAVLLVAATAIGAWHYARRSAAEPKPTLRGSIEAPAPPGGATTPLPPSRPRDLAPAPMGR